ncbi:GNAT family N-acetyltransferase [Gloeocapsa sp. PCC 73106]|uniref:GNAT family N-acetyltransferase n=1 Tax=Gloeocapsa sp. PCC 73106 TaxID=102232 RepID=UPI0002AC3194|nr:GNAT family N-acetyltransferase [Gloeocapsa sp. PCC 73106]ELR98954.1 acetyltransferase [Gloeocapsa sp. PCC 73106]
MFSNLKIRLAQVEDVSSIFALIQALAEYENLSNLVTGSADNLAKDIFGDDPCAEIIVADLNQIIVGFALFFTNYSTFLTRRGIYLEDLFVLPEYRGYGMGKRLLIHLAQLARERKAGRLEWSVLDWNDSAIAFYEKMGASVLPDWRICRVTGTALNDLADLVP